MTKIHNGAGVNNGPGDIVGTTSNIGYATGWGSYVVTTGTSSCSSGDALEFAMPTARMDWSAIVSAAATGNAGHLECLTQEANGAIGNYRCPSGSLPGNASWIFE